MDLGAFRTLNPVDFPRSLLFARGILNAKQELEDQLTAIDFIWDKSCFTVLLNG